MLHFFSYIIWNPSTEAFHIASISVRWYSLCWLIGLILAYLIVQRLYKEQKVKDEYFDPLFIYCFIGILLGARLGHCLFYQPEYFLSSWKHVIEMFIPTKMNLWQVLDDIAIATPITACFIRLGNLMNSEIIGKVTDVPWAFIFERVDKVPRHPGQLYEAIAYAVFFVIGWYLYRKRPEKVGTGFFFGLCLTLIFTFRFFIEYTKDIQVDFESGMLLNMGQVLSLPFIAIGVHCMLRKR